MENIEGVEDTVVVPGGKGGRGRENYKHNEDFCYRVQQM